MKLPERYHPAIVVLHWSVVILIINNLVLGLIVFRHFTSPLLDGIHMTVGIILLLMMSARLVLRLTTTLPADATVGNKFLDLLGRLVHYALYLTVFAITIVGIVYAIQSGRFQSVFLNIQIQPGAMPSILGIPTRMIHRYLGWLLSVLVFGHIMAAAFHQWVKKDHLLSRMWIGRKKV